MPSRDELEQDLTELANACRCGATEVANAGHRTYQSIQPLAHWLYRHSSRLMTLAVAIEEGRVTIIPKATDA